MGHRLGQVFLADFNILDKLLRTLPPHCPHIVEVGCGQGQLSERLAQRCDQLTIVELDPNWLTATQTRLTASQPPARVVYREADILRTPTVALPPHPIHWVTNLPYYISAKFMQRLVYDRADWAQATIMLQQEFAKKLVAKPGEALYSSLGVFCQFYLDIRYAFTVTRTCFNPVPNVDSAVITCTPRAQRPAVNESVLFAIVRSGFWGRRKPLISALKKSPFFDWKPDYAATSAFQAIGNQRAETLDIATFCALAQAVATVDPIDTGPESSG